MRSRISRGIESRTDMMMEENLKKPGIASRTALIRRGKGALTETDWLPDMFCGRRYVGKKQMDLPHCFCMVATALVRLLSSSMLVCRRDPPFGRFPNSSHSAQNNKPTQERGNCCSYSFPQFAVCLAVFCYASLVPGVSRGSTIARQSRLLWGLLWLGERPALHQN